MLGDRALKILAWLRVSDTYVGKLGEWGESMCVGCIWGGGLMSELHPHLTVESQEIKPKTEQSQSGSRSTLGKEVGRREPGVDSGCLWTLGSYPVCVWGKSGEHGSRYHLLYQSIF